jgi:hypothetical protein
MRFKPPDCKRLQGAADARRRARRRTFVLQVPDNKADAVPCERLPFFHTLSNNDSFFFGDRRRHRLAGHFLHRTKARRASVKTRFAFYAFLLVNDMDLVFGSDNRLYRAFLKANHTGLTLLRVDIV